MTRIGLQLNYKTRTIINKIGDIEAKKTVIRINNAIKTRKEKSN